MSSFRFFFSCVDCGVSNLNGGGGGGGGGGMSFLCGKELCCVCFLRSCFSCGRELKPFLLCRVYAEICTYDLDIHVN